MQAAAAGGVLGGVFLAQRKFKRAKATFEEVLERDPRRLGLMWRRLHGAYKALGAESQFEHHIFHGPHRWDGTRAVPWLEAKLTA